MKPSEIARLLPGVFQRTIHPGSPLLALLEVIDLLQAPAEEILENLDGFFDPYRAPERFVPYLARWVDLESLLADMPGGVSVAAPYVAMPSFPSGLAHLRELIAAAAYLSQWRGTEKGLKLFLETATGLEGFRINSQVYDEGGSVRPFHILVQAPHAASAYRGLIERIIQREKPAYVTYELAFDQG